MCFDSDVIDGGAVYDIVVAGDGPAAAAVVAAARRRDLDVIAVGPSTGWAHTYGMWRDEAAELPDTCFAQVTPQSIVSARTERTLERPYGIVDNRALRSHLGLEAVRRHGRVLRQVDAGDFAVAHLDDGDELAGRWLVDATGAAESAAWQTAYGVVVNESDLARAGITTAGASVMSWLDGGVPASFVYAVPVAGGWLVEATSIAARPAIDPQRLRHVLIGVLGEASVVAAEALGRTETVRIPMGGQPIPEPGGRIVPFGAGGGLAHPATGYSLAASLAMADIAADAIAADRDPIAAMWTPTVRRTRALHELGLDMLLTLDRDGLIDFFEAFVDLPVDLWADYLRVDTPDDRVMAAMRAVFRGSPWSVRRRLLRLDKRLLVALFRRPRVG